MRVVKIPSGRLLAAGRALAMLQQKQLASLAKLDSATISRMEASGAEAARGQARNVERVLLVLEKHGVEVGDDYVKLVKKAKR